jgi:hypothetical protein
LRSPSASAGEAALKGLGELPSKAKEAEEQAEPNLYPLRSTVLFYKDPFESAIRKCPLLTAYKKILEYPDVQELQ